jgi:hypothetical protein
MVAHATSPPTAMRTAHAAIAALKPALNAAGRA